MITQPMSSDEPVITGRKKKTKRKKGRTVAQSEQTDETAVTQTNENEIIGNEKHSAKTENEEFENAVSGSTNNQDLNTVKSNIQSEVTHQDASSLAAAPLRVCAGSTVTEDTGPSQQKKQLQFHEMGLDRRVLKAIAQLKWAEPTLIQEKAIPLALDGKDILSRARTGSGKTGAYAIPIIQSLLNLKSVEEFPCTRAVVLVPSRELSTQVTEMFHELISCCSGMISCSNLSKSDVEVITSVANEKPDIIIGTPGRIHSHVKSGYLNLSCLRWLVIDEADLVLSFGYEDDVRKLAPFFPNSYQTFVTSATFTDDVNSLKNVVLKNPVTLQLRESALPSNDRLTQYHVICETEDDKFLLLCALLKLRLIRGKSIIFVNSITRCYRVKLFLEQFSVFCCILNSELPVKSRCHTVEQFNKGLYDYIIAADETQLLGSDSTDAPKSKKKKRKNRPKEFGVSRGVDFQQVSNVINFDFPKSVEDYIHRVGRTARGYANGAALSFVTGDEISALKNAQEKLGENNSLRPYQFAMNEIEGFRYRCRDAVRLVTKQAIKDARLRELRAEMLNSAKLQTYFEENPRDLQVLRHNTVLRPSKVKPHMKHVPEYLIPEALKGIAVQKMRKRRRPTHKDAGTTSKLNPKYRRRREDPLQSFQYVKADKT